MRGCRCHRRYCDLSSGSGESPFAGDLILVDYTARSVLARCHFTLYSSFTLLHVGFTATLRTACLLGQPDHVLSLAGVTLPADWVPVGGSNCTTGHDSSQHLHTNWQQHHVPLKWPAEKKQWVCAVCELTSTVVCMMCAGLLQRVKCMMAHATSSSQLAMLRYAPLHEADSESACDPSPCFDMRCVHAMLTSQ